MNLCKVCDLGYFETKGVKLHFSPHDYKNLHFGPYTLFSLQNNPKIIFLSDTCFKTVCKYFRDIGFVGLIQVWKSYNLVLFLKINQIDSYFIVKLSKPTIG